MGVRLVRQRVCDVCGKDDVMRTVKLGFDGKNQEIDLCPRDASKFDTALRPFIKNAGKPSTASSAPRKRGRPPKSNSPKTTFTKTKLHPDPAAVRAWARAHDVKVPERGRIPNDLVVKFLSATSES